MSDEDAVDRSGTPESATEFRAFLAETGQTQWGFARALQRLGDTRQPATIQRHIQRLATGEHKLGGEMRVIMSIFRHSRRKRKLAEQRAAEAASTSAAERV
jgi:hypothetical protein